MADPVYLDDPAFCEENSGPEWRDNRVHESGRSPSPDQIRRRREAIQRMTHASHVVKENR